jgi:peptide/nickel transport system substrate-binding protein
MAILLCLVLLLPLVACGTTQTTTNSPPAASTAAPSASSQGGASQAPAASSAPASPAAAAKDTINIAIRNDSGTLNACLMTGDTFAAVCCIQEPLWDVTESNDIIMLLAESVEQKSPTEWIIHLRQGVTFSNGNPLTADDFLFSIGLHKAAGATGGPRVQTVDETKTTAIDDYTIDLVLLDSAIHNWTVLAMMLVYDKESYDAEKCNLNPIGTGPYVLKEYVPNSNVNLERRDDYWGTAPAAKYLNFKILSETSQRVNALETGLVDIAPIATEDVEYAKTLADFNIDARYTGNYKGINFNFAESSAFYKNVDARKAVCAAVDPQAIIDAVFLGQGIIMNAAVPDLCFDFEDRFNDMADIYKTGYNPDVAKQLAESSGLAGKTIKLMTDGAAESIKMAEIAQSMLSNIGVTVEINNYDPATVWQMLYDPTAVWDFTIGTGIAPNRRVGDLLLNGVRYSQTMSAPGAFDDNQEYLKLAPLCMNTVDDKERSDILFDVLGRYESNVLSFSLCNVSYSNAYAKTIDLSSVVYTIGTGTARFAAMTFTS